MNEALLVDEVPEASEPMYVNSKTDSDGDSTSMEYDDENQGKIPN